jgi:hypothetical protein
VIINQKAGRLKVLCELTKPTLWKPEIDEIRGFL